ncbi:MAG: hypothetical protein JNN29_10805 [Chitinophagaceae bacterium]|nr:hypothetical protein [Chitinophagaceae bacterium]MBN8667786.1 hypothetical protein [Chitinophagales bacterium]
MQKFTLTALLAFFAVMVFGQKIDDIKEAIGKQDWTKAKDMVDKYMANEKSMKKNEGIWYYKSVVYNEVSKDAALAGLLNGADGKWEAFEAYKKHLEIDPKNILGTLEQNVRLFDIYNGYFSLAVNDFNNKTFEGALVNFKKAWEVEKYIQSKGFVYNNGQSDFSFPAFDTSMVQNIASAAYNAKKVDEAVGYYSQIADAKIGGPDYMNIYQFLVEHYMEKGDKANTEKYLSLGQQLYPENYYWIQVQVDEAGETDMPKRFAKYEEVSKKYPGNYFLLYNYAVELFNFAYTSDTKPADYKQIQTKIEETLNAALAAKQQTDGHEANVLMARHLYNLTFDMQEEQRLIKGQTPADQKKRNDLRDKINQKFDVLLPYALASYDYYEHKSDIKASEKGSWKLIAEIVSACYDAKKMPEKADEYRDKMKKIL